jgi:negative regulator of flagellin synthesis FlgM
MTIQPTSGKASTPALASSPAKSGKAKETTPQKIEKITTDKVDFTAVAKEITKAFESSKGTPAINEKRIEEVKKALAEGKYPINAEKIASKMIQIEREQFNNSR